MLQVTLFSSPDCCLCDDALDLLIRVARDRALDIAKRNIYEDKGLMIKYRHSIPVVKIGSDGLELNWPFNEDDLRRCFAKVD